MSEYSRMAHGSFISSGSSAMPIHLPFQPDFVNVWNLTASGDQTADANIYSMWNSFLVNGEGIAELLNGTSTAIVTASLYPNGITPFSAALSLQFQAPMPIASITQANPALVTTASNHSYSTGDVVLFEGLHQSPTTGMTQICGMPFVITVTGATTFTIPWNTNQSNYTALSGSPVGATVKRLTFPFLYAPGLSFISSLSFGTSTTIFTTAPHNMVVGQEVAFRIPPKWGTIQLNSSENPLVPSSPFYGYVTSVTNSTTVVVNINSSNFATFNTNIAISSVPGLSFPQMLAVGDVNTGGLPYIGGSLYPSPTVNGFSTINGPSISGAFINNTRNGFVIGADIMNGTLGSAFYWQAYLHDYSQGVQFSAL